MKPTQFIKDHGLERAREVVAQALEGHNKFDVSEDQTVEVYKIRNHLVDLRHLKRLVESVDLVNYWGELEDAKDYADFCLFKGREERGNRIKQAIADYESIYGEGNG